MAGNTDNGKERLIIAFLVVVIGIGVVFSNEKEYFTRYQGIKYTIYVIQDSPTYYRAAVVVSPAAGWRDCQGLRAYVIRKKARGRAGFVQIFNNPTGVELAARQHKGTLSTEQEKLLLQYLVTQITFPAGYKPSRM